MIIKKNKWILDTLGNEDFWKGTLDNYIGKILKEYRIKIGKSQRHIAKEAGLSTAAVNELEKGKRLPLSTTLEKICYVFNIVPYYLQERIVRFDKKDYEPFRDVERIMKQYFELSKDPEKIKRIIFEVRKINRTNRLLKDKCNELSGKVIFPK
jgi:transcriptional regulator with XRE-family HTH domain